MENIGQITSKFRTHTPATCCAAEQRRLLHQRHFPSKNNTRTRMLCHTHRTGILVLQTTTPSRRTRNRTPCGGSHRIASLRNATLQHILYCYVTCNAAEMCITYILYGILSEAIIVSCRVKCDALRILCNIYHSSVWKQSRAWRHIFTHVLLALANCTPARLRNKLRTVFLCAVVLVD